MFHCRLKIPHDGGKAPCSFRSPKASAYFHHPDALFSQVIGEIFRMWDEKILFLNYLRIDTLLHEDMSASALSIEDEDISRIIYKAVNAL